MKGQEIRAFLSEVRAAPTEKGTIRFEGYAAKFNVWSQNLGGFREMIMPGAFADSISRGDDVRFLMNHDPNYVGGRTASGTLKLSEDDTGLHFECDAPDVEWTRALKISVERGDINQCSFCFRLNDIGDDEWHWARERGQLDERIIHRAELMDVSIVTFPAYLDTEASARSAHDAARAAEKERADAKARHNINYLRRRMALREREA